MTHRSNEKVQEIKCLNWFKMHLVMMQDYIMFVCRTEVWCFAKKLWHGVFVLLVYGRKWKRRMVLMHVFEGFDGQVPWH